MDQHDPLRFALTRRRFLRSTGVAVGAASLGVGAAATRVGAAPAARRQAAPSGELRVAAPEDGYRADPPERANIGMYPLNTNIFESLVRLTPDYQIEPLLAESCEFVEPNTWRFKLRQGVTFHDGTPFTAEAVRWSMNRIALAGGGQLGVDENSTKVVDDFTVSPRPAQTAASSSS